VFTNRERSKGDFLLEYPGDLIGEKESLLREKEYPKRKDTGSFIYFFTDDKKDLW